MEVKDIEGFEDYQISDDGRVWSKKRNKWMKVFNNGNNYLVIILRKNKIKYHLFIHRLVAKAFIQNPENKPVVGHKDCNSLNNKVENLYWCTQDENNKHPITRLRRSLSKIGKSRPDLLRDCNGRFIKKGG